MQCLNPELKSQGSSGIHHRMQETQVKNGKKEKKKNIVVNTLIGLPDTDKNINRNVQIGDTVMTNIYLSRHDQ